MEKIIYKNNLVIGKGTYKGAYVIITIRENGTGNAELLALTGGIPGEFGGGIQRRNSGIRNKLKEMFDEAPNDLLISKADFDKLIEIWENQHLQDSLSDDDLNFLQSLKSSPENQEIEALDSHGSFSVKVNGQTLFLDSSLNVNTKDAEYGGEHNVYNIRYRIDESETVRSFEFNGSGYDYQHGKNLLSRRDVLSAFECILTASLIGGRDLENINDLNEFYNAFQEGEDTDFTGWVVEDAKVEKPAEVATSATLKM